MKVVSAQFGAGGGGGVCSLTTMVPKPVAAVPAANAGEICGACRDAGNRDAALEAARVVVALNEVERSAGAVVDLEGGVVARAAELEAEILSSGSREAVPDIRSATSARPGEETLVERDRVVGGGRGRQRERSGGGAGVVARARGRGDLGDVERAKAGSAVEARNSDQELIADADAAEGGAALEPAEVIVADDLDRGRTGAAVQGQGGVVARPAEVDGDVVGRRGGVRVPDVGPAVRRAVERDDAFVNGQGGVERRGAERSGDCRRAVIVGRLSGSRAGDAERCDEGGACLLEHEEMGR